MKIIKLSLAVTLTLSATLVSAATTLSRPLTAAEKAAIEKSVKEQLSDPDSATFLHNPYRIGAKIYCAKVNFKNRFGGYVGYHVFTIHVRGGKDGAVKESGPYGEATILNEDGSDGDELHRLLFETALETCTAAGYKI